MKLANTLNFRKQTPFFKQPFFNLLLYLVLIQISWSTKLNAQNLEVIKNLISNVNITDADKSKMGYSVAILDDVAVVGTPRANQAGTQTGAVYIFYKNQGGDNEWGLVKKVINGTGTNDSEQTFTNLSSSDTELFGSSVAILKDVIFVGAHFSNAGGTQQGAVYILERNQGGSDQWGVAKRIVNGVGTDDAFNTFVNISSNNGDAFGWALAAHGSTLVVGVPSDDQGSAFSNAGAVYIFEQDLGGTKNWGLRKKIVFGSGTNTANQLFINPVAPFGVAGGGFGWSVGIYGDNLIAGARIDNQGQYTGGSAFIFNRNQGGTDNWGMVKNIINGTGTNTATRYFLESDIFTLGSAFGESVAIYEDVAVIGHTLDGDGSFCGCTGGGNGGVGGSVYIINKDEGGINNWGIVKRILNGEGTSTGNKVYLEEGGGGGDWFGFTVSLHQDKLMVGAIFDVEGGADRGAIYLFDKNNGGTNNWGFTRKIVNGDGINTAQRLYINETGTYTNNLGYSLAQYQTTLALGAFDETPELGNTYIIDEPLVPLSSSLLHFEGARLNEQEVSLSWSVLSNQLVSEFIIEFSKDGITYQEVLKIDPSAGDNQTSGAYQFDIRQSMAGYYRLHCYSENEQILTAICYIDAHKIPFQVKVYPNPSSESINLAFEDSFKQLFVSATVCDVQGKYLIQKQGELQVVSDWIRNYSEQLKTGTYLLQIQSPEGKAQEVFLKY